MEKLENRGRLDPLRQNLPHPSKKKRSAGSASGKTSNFKVGRPALFRFLRIVLFRDSYTYQYISQSIVWLFEHQPTTDWWAERVASAHADEVHFSNKRDSFAKVKFLRLGCFQVNDVCKSFFFDNDYKTAILVQNPMLMVNYFLQKVGTTVLEKTNDEKRCSVANWCNLRLVTECAVSPDNQVDNPKMQYYWSSFTPIQVFWKAPSSVSARKCKCRSSCQRFWCEQTPCEAQRLYLKERPKSRMYRLCDYDLKSQAVTVVRTCLYLWLVTHRQVTSLLSPTQQHRMTFFYKHLYSSYKT